LKIADIMTITMSEQRDTLNMRSARELTGRETKPTKDRTMTQSSNRILDDFAKLMTDAAGVAQGIRREAETAVKSQAERFLGEMDVVKREEFDVVREMVIRAREENEALKAQVATLEARIEALSAAKPATEG
jgi:BMFP domain-containing protein YqiC